jgi:hypothetical protein
VTIHADFIEDSTGDLVDIVYYCSGRCFTDETGIEAFGHAYPCGDETDYDVWCGHCGVHLWHGLQCDDECGAEGRSFPNAIRGGRSRSMTREPPFQLPAD